MPAQTPLHQPPKCGHTILHESCSECQRLKNQWYDKLETSGFDDKEDREGFLKVWASYFFKVRYNKAACDAKEEYYRAAGHYLHDGEFTNRTEKLIWRKHSEGLSCEDISEHMKTLGHIMPRRKVQQIVSKISKAMIARLKSGTYE